MIFEIPKDSVRDMLIRQISNFFPISNNEKELIDKNFDGVIFRLEKNFIASTNKYYSREGVPYFNPFHSGQWSIFLYYMSNSISMIENEEFKVVKTNKFLADKVYYLNKIMNGVDLFHEISLPDVFGVEHPLGSIMGKAKYSDGFFFYQGCTVGGNHKKYPIIGLNCRMYANSSIIGNCIIGDNVSLGAGALVKDTDIPANCNIFGQSPNLIIKLKNV